MKKKAAAPEPAGESAPMWIVSFADLVTLMMSFFVVLYALKQGGAKQQMDVAAAIKATFDPSYVPPDDSPLEWQMAVRRYQGQPGPPYQNAGGNARMSSDGATGRDPTVTTIRPGKSIVTGSKITFDQNSVELDGTSIDTIKEIVEKLRGLNNVLIVKGHVSGDEITLRPDDPNGMALSYQRALRVAEEMTKLGIDRRVLRPQACGPFEPLKTGAYDALTLRQNRRVEIYATENTAADFSPMSTVPATVAGASEKSEH